jgi:hypothetical protein
MPFSDYDVKCGRRRWIATIATTTCITLSTIAIDRGTFGIAKNGLANDIIQSIQATFLNMVKAFCLTNLSNIQATMPATMEVNRLEITTGIIVIACPLEVRIVSGTNPNILPKRKYIAALADADTTALIAPCVSAVESFIE